MGRKAKARFDSGASHRDDRDTERDAGLPIVAIYQEHSAAVQAFIGARGVPADDVEDVWHEVFLDVWRNRTRYEERGYVRTWLCRIALSRVIDWRRKNGRRLSGLPLEEALNTADDGFEDAIVDRDWLSDAIRRARLTPHQQRAVYLRYVRDCSQAELGRAFCSVGAGKVHQSRGVAHIREAILEGE